MLLKKVLQPRDERNSVHAPEMSWISHGYGLWHWQKRFNVLERLQGVI